MNTSDFKKEPRAAGWAATETANKEETMSSTARIGGRSTWTKIACVVILSFAWAVPSTADIGDTDAEVGVDVGLIDSDFSGDTEFRFGLRGGYFFTERFELEAQAWRAETEIPSFDVSLTAYLLNAVFNFHPRERIVPYVLVGAGRAESSADRIGPGRDLDFDSFAYQVAAGSRFFFSSGGRMAVRIELSMLFEETLDATREHLGLTAGLSWRLGS